MCTMQLHTSGQLDRSDGWPLLPDFIQKVTELEDFRVECGPRLCYFVGEIVSRQGKLFIGGGAHGSIEGSLR